MASIKKNLEIEQGTTFSEVINLTDANGSPIILNGYTANAAFMKNYGYSNVYIFSIAINASAGSITLNMTANQTANVPAIPYPQRYVWDLKLTDSTNVVSRPIEGYITITPAVST